MLRRTSLAKGFSFKNQRFQKTPPFQVSQKGVQIFHPQGSHTRPIISHPGIAFIGQLHESRRSLRRGARGLWSAPALRDAKPFRPGGGGTPCAPGPGRPVQPREAPWSAAAAAGSKNEAHRSHEILVEFETYTDASYLTCWGIQRGCVPSTLRTSHLSLKASTPVDTSVVRPSRSSVDTSVDLFRLESSPVKPPLHSGPSRAGLTESGRF